jgi:drug/metabolite transporter superfamily protein YnfA
VTRYHTRINPSTTPKLALVLAALKTVTISLALFVVAGLFEIGGGWLMWQWLRQGRGLLYAAAGAVLLALYGVLPAFQAAPASCGGRLFLVGVCIIMYWPRK